MQYVIVCSMLQCAVCFQCGVCYSVQYVFNVECNGILNISIDNHVLVGMKQTVYVEMPIYISSYL
jgi:hypothetical protein